MVKVVLVNLYNYVRVYKSKMRYGNCNSPTNWIIEDPIVVRVGSVSTQDTVIPFSAVLDRVDVKAVPLIAIRVTV